ncbi:sulfatase-like hydrolase/transferase [Haloferacaceae archaeon DSL9]
MTRPNVLLLLTDQERYDLSAPDGPAVDTPTIDRLGAEGMRFDRAYTPISICSSARASLLTGLYPHAHGMINNVHEADAIQPNLPSDLPTFGERLADDGYETTYLGKWHVGRDQTPEDFGFRFLGGSDQHHDAIETAFRDYRRREFDIAPDDEADLLEDELFSGHAHEPIPISARTTAPVEATRPYYLAERTIERLEDCAGGGEPFFHRTDFLGPHHPYIVPEPYASMYDPDEIEPWPSYADTFDGKPAAHEQYRRYRGVDDFAWETWAEAIAKYFGFTTFIDEQMGRVLDAVDDLGLTESTLVVHTADHGDFAGGHRQFNKGPLMYEDTYHIPLFVRWPGVVDPASTCEAFVGFHDLMPTFLDAADVRIPDDIDGRSILPLCRGERPDDWPDAAFAEYHGDEFGLYSQRMVRTERFKFVYNAPDRDELYDLDADPHELRNLVDHPDYADEKARLEARLAEWMRDTGDPIGKWSTKLFGSLDSGS